MPHEREPMSAAGRRILVVEDEMLVVLGIENVLRTLGVQIVGPASSVPRALALVEAGGFDGALLDVNLRGVRVDAVADALAARGVPFVFITGYGADGLPEAHRTRPMLTKPFHDADLSAVLTRHMPGG
jgi:CheY-like chemotaxis protein